MPQKGEVGGGSRGSLVPATPLPALERSVVVNLEGLEKVRLVVATNSNECGATHIRLGSWPQGEKVSATVHLHFHTVLSIVLPPFSGFFDTVLSHYQIHALHLDPCSLILLSAFAFLCEALVGFTLSIASLLHFFSLELASKMQCSGCVSLKIDDAPALRIPGIELLHEAEGFRRQRMLVKAAGEGALFQPPPSSATPNRGSEHEDLSDPRLAPVLNRLGQLRHAGVSMAMVVREFICRRIAPLQCHSCPMWAYAGPNDSMRTQVATFSPIFLRELLRRLTGGNLDELPPAGQLLYRLKAVKDLTADMPLFDEWGLLPEGKEQSQGVVPHGVQPREDADRAVASRIMVGDAPVRVPQLGLHVGPGLVVMIGRQWKMPPLLPSLARGLSSPSVRAPLPAVRRSRPWAAVSSLVGLRRGRSGWPLTSKRLSPFMSSFTPLPSKPLSSGIRSPARGVEQRLLLRTPLGVPRLLPSHCTEPCGVFFVECLQFFEGMPFPSPMAPPGPCRSFPMGPSSMVMRGLMRLSTSTKWTQGSQQPPSTNLGQATFSALVLFAVRGVRTLACLWSLLRVHPPYPGACSAPLRMRFNVWRRGLPVTRPAGK
ncbi:hypothetical protein D1007_04605 [Hordeum vulgare]|nr:hypothetical protein D1007_04605 [Hordeum vulgare]